MIAWAFDFFFWDQVKGISITIFLVLLLGGVFLLAQGENKLPARASLWLLLPIGFLTVMTFVRRELFTLFLSVTLPLTSMALLAHTFRGGRWASYSLSDYGIMAVNLLASALVRSFSFIARMRQAAEEVSTGAQGFSLRSLFPAFRGLFLAVPVVVIFASLLASADFVFAARLEDFIALFDIELTEYIFRGMYILAIANVLSGVYLHALLESKEERLIGLEKPWLAPFLGFTEATVILGSVNLLFIIFVGIQFQYFFGGQANITLEGFTYAEYARRGFRELVAVAFCSLLLHFGLSTITRRESDQQRKVFSGLGVTLVVLVGAILASAFQRLLLYEAAFGFTRLRTYSHVLMVWLGVLLVAFVLLEVRQRQRCFALAVLLVSLGFGVTLSVINVDGLIVRQNVARAQVGFALDSSYLATLSEDAVPELVTMFDDPSLAPELHDDIGMLLACLADDLDRRHDELDWRGFHFSRNRAGRLLADHAEALRQYPIRMGDRGPAVTVGSEQRSCLNTW